MSRRRLARALVPAALLALVAAAPADAISFGARVAVDPEGTAHVAWLRVESGKDRLMSRSRTSTGILGGADYLTSLAYPASENDLVAGAAGTVVHTWLSGEPDGDRVRMRARSADGSLSPLQNVSDYGVASAPKIVADPSGAATIAWLRRVGQRYVLEMRRRAADGSLGPVTRLSSATPTYSVADFDLGVDAAGHAVAAWTLGTQTGIVQARRRTTGGTLSAIQNVTTTAAAADAPVVAVDPQGNAVIAFRRERGAAFVVQARRRSAGGTLGPLEDVSPVAGGVLPPRISGDPSGGVTIAWPVYAPGERVVHAVRRAADGTYDAVDAISPEEVVAQDWRLGTDADGDAVFSWWRSDGTGRLIQTRRRSAAGALFPTIDVASGSVGDPDLGVEPGGGAFVTWTDYVAKQVVGRRRTEGGELSAAQTLSY